MNIGKLNIVAISLVLAYGSIFATDYYVDNNATTNPPGASGANQGTITHPYTSHIEINNHTGGFLPGDRIFLKRGNVYTYTQHHVNRGPLPERTPSGIGVITPLGSGAPGSPILIDAYGIGSRPIINAEGNDYSAGILLLNQDNWVIQNLEITNTSPHIGMINRWGILVFFNPPSYGGTNGVLLKRNITISNNYVHDIFGSNVRNLEMYYSGGIYVEVGFDPDTVSSSPNQRIEGLTIENNQVENITGTGVLVFGERGPWKWAGGGPFPMNWNNLSKSIIIRKNSVKNTCDGILIMGLDNPLVEFNTIDNAGGTGVNPATYSICGLWTAATRDGLIQYNEVMNTKALPGDGIGLHHDIIHSGTAIYQYNYSHDNAGGFISGNWPWPGDDGTPKVIWRYNVSLNDRSANASNTLIYFSQGLTEIYNNTVYTTEPLNINYFPNASVPQPPNMVYIANNIFFSTTGSASFSNNTQVKYENNLYSNIPSNGADLNAISPIPISSQIFENPSAFPNGIKNISGFTQKANSPGINKGIKINDNGNKDFRGAALFGIPDVGAYERSNIVPTILTPLFF